MQKFQFNSQSLTWYPKGKVLIFIYLKLGIFGWMMNFFSDKIVWLFLKSNLKKFQKLYDKDNGIVKEKYLTIWIWY